MTLALWTLLSLLALAGYALAVIGVPRWARRRMEVDALMASKDFAGVDTSPEAYAEDAVALSEAPACDPWTEDCRGPR